MKVYIKKLNKKGGLFSEEVNSLFYNYFHFIN